MTNLYRDILIDCFNANANTPLILSLCIIVLSDQLNYNWIIATEHTGNILYFETILEDETATGTETSREAINLQEQKHGLP